jgi:hypothetical protein
MPAVALVGNLNDVNQFMAIVCADPAFISTLATSSASADHTAIAIERTSSSGR